MRRSVYDMPKKELEKHIIDVVRKAIVEDARRTRRRWVGSEITDQIIGSDRPTHRRTMT